MPLYAMLLAVLGLSGAVLGVCMWAYRSPLSAAHRIREERERRLKGWRLAKSAVVNSTLSVTLIMLVTQGFYDALFTEVWPAWWVLLVQAVGILALYDVLYYLTHRFAFHRWKPLRAVHAVHHMARYPQAIDALFIHPVETLIGLGLLLGCTLVMGPVVMGPVNIYAFAAVFLVYSLLNILIHAGISLPFFPFRAISYMARKHDTHHVSMAGGNYASISPVCDLLFGTAE